MDRTYFGLPWVRHHLELTQSVPPEVAVSTEIAVKVKVWCPSGCDLRGGSVTVKAAEDRTMPQATSLAVWANPSPVMMGHTFTIMVGAKSSGACELQAAQVEIQDETGARIAVGTLGETPGWKPMRCIEPRSTWLLR